MPLAVNRSMIFTIVFLSILAATAQVQAAGGSLRCSEVFASPRPETAVKPLERVEILKKILSEVAFASEAETLTRVLQWRRHISYDSSGYIKIPSRIVQPTLIKMRIELAYLENFIMENRPEILGMYLGWKG